MVLKIVIFIFISGILLSLMKLMGTTKSPATPQQKADVVDDGIVDLKQGKDGKYYQK